MLCCLFICLFLSFKDSSLDDLDGTEVFWIVIEFSFWMLSECFE